VSGRVTPDSFVVQKGSLALLEREIFEKELAIYPHPDGGGTIEKALARDRAVAPSLRDDEATTVAKLASDVERYFGSPQDVEWGMAGGQIYLLQSRPITTLG
jgi:phosphoenolpyruvate synthase/pyruvate phosphate dikinase